MSLKDQLEGQEDRAQQLKAALDALAGEYMREMQAMGIQPFDVVDTTGVYRVEPVYDESDHVHIQCRPTDKRAWFLYVSQVSDESGFTRELGMAVTTTGTMLVTERTWHVTPDGWLRGNVVMSADYGALDKATVLVLVYKKAFGDHARSATSWWPLREIDQHNLLLAWAQKAQFEGLEAVTLPVERSMLAAINWFRRQ